MYIQIKDAFKLTKMMNQEVCYERHFFNIKSVLKFLEEEERFDSQDLEWIDMEGEIQVDRGHTSYTFALTRISIEGEIF